MWLYSYINPKRIRRTIVVDVAKNRNGAQGETKLYFHKEIMRFESIGGYEVSVEDEDLGL